MAKIKTFDWLASCRYNDAQKAKFHTMGRTRLRQLARELAFEDGSFDVRSNLGGVAVSGEVTLHHDRVYVQISQPSTGSEAGILIRTCNGQQDYLGGPNHYAHLSLLDDLGALATTVRKVLASSGKR